MKTFHFKAASWILFFLTFIFSIVGGISLVAFLTNNGFLPKGYAIGNLLYIGSVFLITIYLIRLAAFAKVEITISENTISIKWLEHFLFDNRPDVNIPLSEVAEYVNQGDSNWDWIKIKLKDETVYRIWHSNYLSKDDYRRFVSAFIHAVKNFNESIEGSVDKGTLQSKLSIIQRSKTIYKTTWGLILGIIGVMMIVGIPILLFVLPIKRTPNYGLLIAPYIGAIYFVSQVYLKRKKDKMINKPSNKLL